MCNYISNLPILYKLDARIPSWADKQLISRNCPFCDSYNQPIVRRPDNLPIAFCCKCGTSYVSMAPTDKVLMEYYSAYWTTIRPQNLSHKTADQMRIKLLYRVHEFWIDRLHVLIGLNGKIVVDVGCGLGNALLICKKEGARVIGVDLNKEACAFVRNQLKLDAREGALEDIALEDNSVDIVLMRDFLEHPLNPSAVFKKGIAILKPGGLMLIHTPNGSCIDFKDSSNLERIVFRVDLEHMQYLSAKTLMYLANKNHLIIEHLETFGFPSLQGIDKLPEQRMFTSAYKFKDLIKNCPGMLHVINLILKMKQIQTTKNYRSGNYNLLAILRKEGVS